MNSRLITIVLSILIVIKVFLYASLIPFIILGFCLVGLLKKTIWGAILLIIVSIASSLFDLYAGSLYGFLGIIGALIINIPMLLFGLLNYKELTQSKRKKVVHVS